MDVDWCKVDEAQVILRDFFRTKSALKYHLARRDTNGLREIDAVRETPMGRLIVNPDRVRSWCLGETRAA